MVTYQEYVQKKTMKDLLNELRGLDDAIDGFECFNSRDVTLREHIEAEIVRRTDRPVRRCING